MIDYYNYDNVCISLDPKAYLCANDEDILFRVADLIGLLDKVAENNCKFIYNYNFEFLEQYIDCHNLFTYDSKDPSFIFLSTMFEDKKKYIKEEYVLNDQLINLSEYSIYNNYVQNILYCTFMKQYESYHNKIILANNPVKEILINNNKFYITNDLDSDNLDIRALKVINYDNRSEVFFIYHWFFQKELNYNIYISNFVLNNISNLSVDFCNAIISLFRSIFYPDYLYKHNNKAKCKYTIECHTQSSNSFSVNGKHYTPYRAHIVDKLGRTSSKSDRFFYIKVNTKYIFVGITNNHSFSMCDKNELGNFLKIL